MYELTIAGSFAAAHFLPGYDGACKELHGHTWKLEVTIEARDLNAIGLVMDFKDLRARLHSFLKQLDHGCLNNLEAFREKNPTTENLAFFIYHGFSAQCAPFKVKQVRIWESDSASVTYYE